VARGFLSNTSGSYESFVKYHRPDITRGSSHLGRAIRYAALWDEPVLEKKHFDFRIDKHNHNDILDMLEYLGLWNGGELRLPGMVGTPINASFPKRTWIGEIINHPDGYLIEERHKRLGYQ
jgi:hypothetical protein